MEENATFFWYCLNTAVCEFSNFSIGGITVIQKKFIKLH